MSTERLERLRRCCDAYGADPVRWPDELRAELGALYASDEAAGIRADAEALDGFLNAATAPRMSEDLPRRIAASYAPPRRRLSGFEHLRGFFSATRLIPAGALAGLGALGFATGIAAASAQTAPMTPESEALAYLDGLAIDALDEQGDLTWDAD